MSGTTYTRSSQVVAEALSGSTTTDAARASQVAAEVLTHGVPAHVRVSQFTLEVLVSGTTSDALRATQVVVEAEVTGADYTRISQTVAEALSGGNDWMRITQCIVEALVASKELPLPSIYPALAGLSYSVVKRPIGNVGIAESTSGGEVRVNYWNTVLWEWDLTYEYLPDFSGTGGTTSSDLKALMGFYASTGAGFSAFCFQDPDDYQVLGQNIGTGDGTTTLFYLVRTYGLSAYGTTTDNVGYLNTTGAVLNGHAAFNVYVNGTLKTLGTDYAITQATPMQQYITFTTAPASGAVVTVDMSFYYWVRFLDPKYDFEKFMSKLWSTKKITLHSLRY